MKDEAKEWPINWLDETSGGLDWKRSVGNALRYDPAGHLLVMDNLAERLPCEVLGHGFRIERPTGERLDAVRQQMVALSTWTGGPFDFRPQEILAEESSTGGHTLYQLDREDQWRYRVITWNGEHGVSPIIIQIALRLCEDELYAPLIGSRSQADRSYAHYGNLLEASQYYKLNVQSTVVRTADLSDLDEIARLVDQLDEKLYPSIDRSLRTFIRLDSLADYVPLKHLGYFTVIESLLTHKPQPSDSADSIRRQLQRNVPLLNNRLGEYKQDLDYVTPTFIKKLYDYRSDLAHGGDGFSTLKPAVRQVIGSPSEVALVLRLLSKRLLVQALREPRLVSDLKGPDG